MIYYYVKHWSDFVALELWYCKLVETFHVGGECNTAIYFSWCLIQALAQPVQLFLPLVTFSVASGNSLTDLDLKLFIETEQDWTRHTTIGMTSKRSSMKSLPNTHLQYYPKGCMIYWVVLYL
jgi:hypothetical protein